MLLSRSWLRFIFQNYAWSQFPLHSHIFLLSGYLSFLEHFESLGGIEVPYFPGDYITQVRLALLSTAKSVSIAELKIPSAVELCLSDKCLAEKI